METLNSKLKFWVFVRFISSHLLVFFGGISCGRMLALPLLFPRRELDET